MDGALGDDLVGERGVLGRIDARVAAAEHGDGAGRKAGAVGGGVDAARQPGDDAEAGLAEIARDGLRELDAGGRGVARADDGDQRPVQDRGLAAHGDQRRRVVDHGEPQRIVRLAERDELDAAGAGGFQLGGGLFFRADAAGAGGAAAAGERRQRMQARRARRRNG